MSYTQPRSSWAQQQRLGYEGVNPGTKVACTRRLQNLHIDVTPKPEVKKYRGPGFKVNNLVFPNRIWTEFDLEGPLSYDELLWPLAALLGVQGLGTPPAPSGYLWTMNSGASTQDTYCTYSLETGDTEYCDSVACLMVPDLTISLTRPELKMTGKGIGMQLLDSATPTTSGIALYGTHKAVGNEVKVFTASTYETLIAGGTAQADAISAELTVTGKWGPNWVLDSDYNSYKGPVELPPEATLKLKMQHNAASYAFLNQLYAGSVQWINIVSSSKTDTVDGTTPYSLQLTCPFYVGDASKPADSEGVWSMEWPLSPTISNDLTDAPFWLQAILCNGDTGL